MKKENILLVGGVLFIVVILIFFFKIVYRNEKKINSIDKDKAANPESNSIPKSLDYKPLDAKSKDSIKKYQAELNKKGFLFNNKSLAVDGIWGAKTQFAYNTFIEDYVKKGGKPEYKFSDFLDYETC